MKEKDIQIDRLTGLNEALQKENQSQQEKIVGLYTKVNDFSKLAEETFQDHIDDKSELQKDLKKKLDDTTKNLEKQNEAECKDTSN